MHINDHYGAVGGTETYLLALLDGLESRGVGTSVIFEHAFELPNKTRSVNQVNGLSLFTVVSPRNVMMRIRETLERERPDIIHLHNGTNPYITDICRTYAPTIRSVHTHSYYCPGGGKYFPVSCEVCKKQFGPLCLTNGIFLRCNSRRPGALFRSYARSYATMRKDRLLPVVLVASRYVRDCMVQNGYSRDAVRVLPYFTDLPDIPQRGLCESLILFTGRVAPQKGLDVLLKSLKHLKASFHLVVDGDGPDLGRTRKLARELEIEDRVEFVGWAPREKHLAYYQRASVVVVPSVWPEPFGMVGIEAMSCGKPVVAFNVGGIPEWLEHGVTGFLVKPYDVKEMAEKIDYLLENPDVAREMGMRGREKVEREFNKEIHLKKLTMLYQDAMDR